MMDNIFPIFSTKYDRHDRLNHLNGTDNEKLEDLVEEWKEDASKHGSSVSGSIGRAAVYAKCAKQLQEAIEE